MSKPGCPKCGCTDIVEDGTIYEYTRNSWRNLGVTVYANPDAMLFKGEATSTLMVRVCASCGFAELYVNNPQALWQAHLQRVGQVQQKPAATAAPPAATDAVTCMRCGTTIPPEASQCPSCGWSFESG